MLSDFQTEYERLFDWSTKELERIDEKYPFEKGVGLDGPEVIEQKEHFREYNKRLLALKAKYNIE